LATDESGIIAWEQRLEPEGRGVHHLVGSQWSSACGAAMVSPIARMFSRIVRHLSHGMHCSLPLYVK
jgi:hypothetical protein